MQLENSYYINIRKKKTSMTFDDEFDYLYGIVTTGRAFGPCVIFINRSYILIHAFICLASDWYFLMYTPERIYCTKADYHIALTEDVLDNDKELRQGVKKVMEGIG